MPFGFFRNAWRDFSHVASFFPSSSFACRAIVSQLPPTPRVVVEYGPGSGVVTRELLSRLPYHGKVIAFEINTTFAGQLRRDPDPRLRIIDGDIVEASARLRELAPEGLDAVISGIPFSFLSAQSSETIVRNTFWALKERGRFIVYQYSPKMMGCLAAHFPSVSSRYEFRNILPYFIMVAQK